jgi:glycosyltransferase involved in cell wall biosynthesis
LKKEVIDEIIICDENGNDFYKINEKYYDLIDNGIKLKVYKNYRNLGVFLNKLKVCKMANNDYIALIDSDNRVDEDYFKKVKEYIEKNNLPDNVVLSPCFGRPHDGMDYRRYNGKIMNKTNIKEFVVEPKGPEAVWDIPLMWNISSISLLNMGNFVISKNVFENFHVPDKEILPKIAGCDVIYFLSLLFERKNSFEFHVVEGLEYDHSVHEGSLQLKEQEVSNVILWETLVPHMYYTFN